MTNSTQTSQLLLEEQLLRNPQEMHLPSNNPDGTPFEIEKFERILRGEHIGFPELLDNTARSNWVQCPEKFFRSTVQELRGNGFNIHLSAGGAIASALETARIAFFEANCSALEAEALGLKKLYEVYPQEEMAPARSGDKSIEGCVRAYENYFLEYPLGKDEFIPVRAANGRCGAEFTFAQVIPEIMHPETGNPLLYGGRFDLLAERRGKPGEVWVQDEKTTSALGDAWAKQFDLDSQMTGYIWASRSYGYNTIGAILRGIGMLKTKTTFAFSLQERPTWRIAQWMEQLQYDCEDMIRAWKRNWYRKSLDKSACAAYGGCTFKMLCESPAPDAWLRGNYKVVHWDPTEKH